MPITSTNRAIAVEIALVIVATFAFNRLFWEQGMGDSTVWQLTVAVAAALATVSVAGAINRRVAEARS